MNYIVFVCYSCFRCKFQTSRYLLYLLAYCYFYVFPERFDSAFLCVVLMIWTPSKKNSKLFARFPAAQLTIKSKNLVAPARGPFVLPNPWCSKCFCLRFLIICWVDLRLHYPFLVCSNPFVWLVFCSFFKWPPEPACSWLFLHVLACFVCYRCFVLLALLCFIWLCLLRAPQGNRFF